jgi:hypothetical protein
MLKWYGVHFSIVSDGRPLIGQHELMVYLTTFWNCNSVFTVNSHWELHRIFTMLEVCALQTWNLLSAGQHLREHYPYIKKKNICTHDSKFLGMKCLLDAIYYKGQSSYLACFSQTPLSLKYMFLGDLFKWLDSLKSFGWLYRINATETKVLTKMMNCAKISRLKMTSAVSNFPFYN